jgi:hypothetical protein
MTLLRLKSIPGALLLAVALAAAAQNAPPAAPVKDAFLGQLAGNWDMNGTLRGKPVRYHAVGRWLLNDSWLCLTMMDVARPPAYQASVYFGFDAQAGDYIAHWLDQFGAAGARVVGTGKREGGKLVLLFPYAEGAFRDTLSLATDGRTGTLLIESRSKDGSWSTFASYTLTRPGTPAATRG